MPMPGVVQKLFLYIHTGELKCTEFGYYLFELIEQKSTIPTWHYGFLPKIGKRVKGKHCRPRSDASDQGLQCLLTGFSIKNRIKATKYTHHP